MSNPTNATMAETLEQQKELLTQSADRFKHNLEHQWDELKGNAKQWSRTGLIVGGVALVSFLLVRTFFSSTNKNVISKQGDHLLVEPKKESMIVSLIKSSIATFLLSVAKEKIINFIEQMNHKQDIDGASSNNQPAHHSVYNR